MTIVYILAGIVLLGVIIFRMGGKELDRRLTAVGGLRKMYAPLVKDLLSKPKAIMLKETPSRLVIVGQQDRYNYMWQISTPDGKKITIRITVKNGNQIMEKKDFDFPISTQFQSDKILATIRQHIDHKEVLEDCQCQGSEEESVVMVECLSSSAREEPEDSKDKAKSIGENSLEEHLWRKMTQIQVENIVAKTTKECALKGYDAPEAENVIRLALDSYFNSIDIEKADSILLLELGSEIGGNIRKLIEEEKERAYNLYLPNKNR